MSDILSDQDIRQLIVERKRLPSAYNMKIQVKPKRGHKERELEITGEDGNEFCIILRESSFNHLDFSIILAHKLPQSNVLFRLRRYNGKSHEHTNLIERFSFYDYHIHMATERYQTMGAREDSFAERTNRFSNFSEAFKCLIEDCGFDIPTGSQIPLF
jgi:hypothetical protein